MTATEIRDAFRPVLARKKPVVKAILFGSFARGTQTRKSDIDLVIITETTERFFDRYSHFTELLGVFGATAVEMLIYTPEELQRIAHRPFIQRILTEGTVIYER